MGNELKYTVLKINEENVVFIHKHILYVHAYYSQSLKRVYLIIYDNMNEKKNIILS